MLRRAAIIVVLTAALAPSAQAQGTPLLPGITYDRTVAFTPHGVVVLHVITAPRPGGLYALTPVLARGTLTGGLERVTEIQRDLSATATTAGITGDFVRADGRPSGEWIGNGLLAQPPLASRSSIGIDAAGTLHVDRVRLFGTWQGAGQRRTLAGLNQPPTPGQTVLFTSAYGPRTPVVAGGAEAVLGAFPPTAPNADLAGQVSATASGGGDPIPPGGAVVMAVGGAAAKLQAEARIGTTVHVRLGLQPAWEGVTAALGGGPLLVRSGKAVFRSLEDFTNDQIGERPARGAVGQLADGRIVLVTVEGGGSAYSAGMTNYELAVALSRLGARTAMALASGPAAAMAFDGTLLTRPAATGELPIADALFLSYSGVYAAPPSSGTLSPNGDGVDDSLTFTVKLVRRSQVTASVVGPGVTIPLVQDTEDAGVHTLQWDGIGAVEGNWRFVVTAVDDTGRSTTADRSFALNETLGSLAVSRAGQGLTATFALAHPATVTVTVEKPNGIVLATLLSKKLDAGPQSATWSGRAASGYRVRVVATNAIGKATLVAPVTARRS
jgi:hypothetical protein